MEALQAERTIEAQGRLENLEELVGVGREYDAAAAGPGAAEGEGPSVEQFLQQVALFSEQDQLRGDEGIVTLMTMHNAKGLEYDTVFIIGLEDGVFPHMRAIEAGDLEEERRLCYVGITRARRELYLSHARSRSLFGARDWNLRSRFIDEIPADLTDREEDAVTGPAAAATWEGGAAATPPGPGRYIRARRRCGPRELRRGGGHRHGAGRARGGALRLGRIGAQADGRLRTTQEAWLRLGYRRQRARGSPARARGGHGRAARGPPRRAARARHDPRGRRPGIRGLRAHEAQRQRGGGHRVVPPRAPRGHLRAGTRGPDPRTQRRSAGARHPAPAATADAPRTRRRSFP